MKFLEIFIILCLSSFQLTTCCLSKAKDASNKISTTNPKVIVSSTKKPIQVNGTEDGIVRYEKYGNQERGFYIEIEEDLNNKVTVRQFKKLPVIYNQLIHNKTHPGGQGIQNDGPSDDTKMEEVKEPGVPPVSSLVEDATESNWTAEDEQVRLDWLGSCDARFWAKCNNVKKIQVMNVYNKTVDRDTIMQHLDLDCLLEPIVCLRNGWTANRCHILCMSKCNHEILQGWENFVSYEGACRYI